MQAAVNEDSKTELDSLRDSKPVKLTQKRRHVLCSPGRVDKSSGSIENIAIGASILLPSSLDLGA